MGIGFRGECTAQNLGARNQILDGDSDDPLALPSLWHLLTSPETFLLSYKPPESSWSWH